MVTAASARAIAIDEDVIHRGYIVYNGMREFPVSDKISVIPATQILSGKLE
jgi:hypothetical protein